MEKVYRLQNKFIGFYILTVNTYQQPTIPYHLLPLTLSTNLMLNPQLVGYHGNKFRVSRLRFGDINGVAE